MKKAEELLKKYNDGTASAKEKAIVESWYLNYKTPPSNLKSEELQEEYQMGLKKLHESLEERKAIRLWPRLAIAASLMICVGLGWLLFRSEDKAVMENTPIAVLLPETNSAVLTLADGTQVRIQDGNIGEIAEEHGIKISQTADGQLLYTVVDAGKGELTDHYNTIETPTGNQYTVVLPDGSKVWLSSASKLRYPVHFSEKERKVALAGEAYFEVKPSYSSKNTRKIPFIVSSGHQDVEVLGTAFNISAYEEDRTVKTALVEGSVRVSLQGNSGHSRGTLLKPGQMSVTAMNSGEIQVVDIDVDDIKAWREGYFIFNNENIKDIMKKLAKWYGFAVEYRGDMSGVEFQGNYLRTRNLNHLLETMEMTNKVKFEINTENKERRVVVKRNN